MESCAYAIKKKENALLDDLLFVNTCMLHGRSKALELSWLEFFGKFGIGEQTVSQLVFDLWYIQDCLKYFFMLYGTYLLVNNGKDHSYENVSYPNGDTL